MGSVVTEFHDSPNLKHLDELSTEIFDSPRVQVGIHNSVEHLIVRIQRTIV